MSVFVIVTPGFPKDEDDTTCLPAVQQFLLSLKKNHSDTRLIILSFQYPFERKKYKWNNLEVISLGGRNKGKFSRLSVWVRAYFTLRDLHRNYSIKGVISLWLTECSLVTSFFCRANKIDYFMWIHGQDARQENSYIKWLKPEGTHVIALSDFLQQEFEKNHHIKPFLVAENGITPSSFPELNTSARKIDLLGVGSLIKLKNYTFFIEIVAELKKTHPTIQAVIVGSGEEESTLKKYAADLHLENNLLFKGKIQHHEVFELMNQAKIFLHTSTYEGNSTVLMEALYSGCYTLSTQPLSSTKTENLDVKNKASEFVNLASLFLSNPHPAKRVVFNTMDNSVKKIMNLFSK